MNKLFQAQMYIEVGHLCLIRHKEIIKVEDLWLNRRKEIIEVVHLCLIRHKEIEKIKNNPILTLWSGFYLG